MDGGGDGAVAIGKMRKMSIEDSGVAVAWNLHGVFT